MGRRLLWWFVWGVLLVGCRDTDGTCDALGLEGCPCAEDETCMQAEAGEDPLACVAGLCERVPCDPGSQDCMCAPGLRCASGLRCAPGEGDGDGDADAPGRCTPICPAGTAGCDCLSDDTCLDDRDGVALMCALGSCARSDCDPGSPKCVCDGRDGCQQGFVCQQGYCAADTGQTLTPPQDPVCYTPCQGGGLNRTVAGETRYVECSEEGLIEGCIGDAVCIDGTCVTTRGGAAVDGDAGMAGAAGSGDAGMSGGDVSPGQSSPGQSSPGRSDDGLPDAGRCTAEADCPTHQNCIAGRCYSDCEVDDDCRAPRACHRKACRLPCKGAAEGVGACPDDLFCHTEDGETGFCLPLVAGSSTLSPPTSGAYGLSTGLLSFTSSAITGSFEIENRSPSFQQFTLRRRSHREYTGGQASAIEANALSWLRIGLSPNDLSAEAELRIGVEGNGGRTTVYLGEADNPTLDRWDGILEVVHPTLGVQELQLTYARLPEGRWSGEMFYFANFGTAGLDAWRRDRDSDVAVRAVGNALIRRWHALRKGRISMREFKAALTATRDETWKNASVRSRCPSQGAANPNAGCYLYDNNDGIAIYSDFLPDNPIPSGVAEFPLALNLRKSGSGVGDWSGRIVSDIALQYAGDPAIEVRFDGDPTDCTMQYGDTCLTPLTRFEADVIVGGRYAVDPADTGCFGAEGYRQLTIPWLVPGFTADAHFDASSDRYLRYECRDAIQPFGTAPDKLDLNKSFAAANPFRNGQSLKRRLRMLDGALINQTELFVLFEEQFPSPFDPVAGEALTAHGYLILQREPADLNSSAYAGTVSADNRTPPPTTSVGCSADILAEANGGAPLDASNVAAVAQVVVQGAPVNATTVAPLAPSDSEHVHYLCEDTGYFDGGPKGDVPCPAGSRVAFFTVTDDRFTPEVEGSFAWVTGLSCQTEAGVCQAGQPCAQPTDCSSPYVGTPGESRDPNACVEAEAGCTVGQPCPNKGNCGTVLARWQREAESLGAIQGNYGPPPSTGVRNEAEALRFRPDPVWTCKDPLRADCSRDRIDLRTERNFYPYVPSAPPTYRALATEVDQAFRYKTKFRGREGTSLGFTPDICVENSDIIPYCYAPTAIEKIRARTDCAASIYTDWYNDLAAQHPTTLSMLKAYLTRSFAYLAERDPGQATPRVIDGFERLNAELLVMLGDEALTDASASRFDLAGQRVAPFPGDELEPDGLRLSGGAGFEMFSLYLATQYYQEALDRFFHLGPLLDRSLNTLPAGEGFITQASATSWFDRLIGASSHKARAWSEVARRYQSFNRPDLARLVIGRAYNAAYMEAALLSRVMFSLTDTADASEVAQLVSQVELAQRTYRKALRDMQQVYDGISDDVTFFGFPPDFVPFPALSRTADTNAFQEVLARAKSRMQEAASKETAALSERRAFETDGAQFQSELSGLRIEYDQQLQEICGGFEAVNPEDPADVRVVPAIPENAALNPRLAVVGDPCGHVGNGTLYEAMLAAEQELLAMDTLRLQQRHLMEKVLGTEARAQAHCQSAVDYANWTLKIENEKFILGTVIEGMNLGIDLIERFASTTEKTLSVLACAPLNGECAVAGAIATTSAGLSTGWNLAVAALKVSAAATERGKARLEIAQVVEGILQGCDAVKIDAQFAVKNLFRDAAEIQSRTLEQAVAMEAAIAKVRRLRNEATSLLSARDETLAHLLNVEAARNDPNIRIYTQDSVFAAERTFRRALAEAYKATRVFEYYTNQSYAAREDLFLVRMVQFGEPSLEAYMASLEDEFIAFEEQFGKPDLRVAIVSMRDDILRVPELADDGTALSHAQRVARFRALLKDPRLLDDRGYISAPFATLLKQVSPLTFNHKVRFVEAELVMQENLGDRLGRVYLAQRGTGTVRDADAELTFYSFPERTAVLDAFFNGERPLSVALRTGEDIYRSERLRDRPLINSGWQMSFNQKDELVNEDIDIGSLDDIRLYLYYTDFTEL